MRKTLWPLLFGASLIVSSFAVVACGDDDTGSSTSSSGGTSSGTSGNPEGGTSGSSGSSGSSGTSGNPDGGCTFAGFVTNLITTQTTATAVPSTDLGEKCTDSTSQDDFKSLFQ